MDYFNKYLKYKSKYLELKQKGGDDEIPKVYIPYFHSCHLDDIKEIPKGCVLVNTSVCGLSVPDITKTLNKLQGLFNTLDKRLCNPIGNKEELEELLDTKLSIHTSGVNNQYLNMKFSNNILIEKNELYNQICSGLYEMGQGICEPIQTNSKLFSKDILLKII